MMKRTIALLLASVLMSLPVWGCSEAEELVDCAKVCEAKQDCVDSAYDVERCTDECETRSDSDEEYRREINECEACIDDRACAEQISCFDNCPSLP